MFREIRENKNEADIIREREEEERNRGYRKIKPSKDFHMTRAEIEAFILSEMLKGGAEV